MENSNGKVFYKFFFTVKGLIFYNNKFLIIRRSPKARGDNLFWDLPGGRLEFLETPISALNREISEETGIKHVQILYPINLWHFLKTPTTQVIGVTYLCKTNENKVYLSNEHFDYVWITKDEINNYNICSGILQDMNKWDWQKLYSDLNINF